MSNYTIQVSWAGKDDLDDTDPAKVISGDDFDTEFTAVKTAINSKANLNGDATENFAINALTVAGTATLNADPSLALEAATKQYVDAATGGSASTALTSLDSLDTTTTEGWYIWTTDAPTNYPTLYGVMVVKNDGDQPLQIVWGGTGGAKQYMRRKDSGTWTAWETVINDGDTLTGSTFANATFTGTVTLPDDSVDIADINATGTTDSTTVLYGDGTWGTIDVATPLAALSFADVGSYALLMTDTDGTSSVAVGSTRAGSQLVYGNWGMYNNAGAVSVATGTSSPAGTWQNMGLGTSSYNNPGSEHKQINLWLRTV